MATAVLLGLWLGGAAFAAEPRVVPTSIVRPAAPDPDLRAALMEAVKASDSFEDRFNAEVWLADMSDRLKRFRPNALPDVQERLAFLRLLHSEASRAQLPPELVLAVIDIESRFDRFAVSNVGAQGYMQVMPFWLKEIGRPYDNLFKAGINLRIGCTILKYYLDREKGSLVRALRAYNGNERISSYSDKVLTALSYRWFRQ